MTTESVHILSAGREVAASRATGHPHNELWIDKATLANATGWMLKPEGLCRDDVCMLLDESDRARLAIGDAVCASGLWEALGRPVVSDTAGTVWMLGEAASDRSSQLASLEAPDFTLPDITGKLHSLSDYRGKKVFLATWASW